MFFLLEGKKAKSVKIVVFSNKIMLLKLKHLPLIYLNIEANSLGIGCNSGLQFLGNSGYSENVV